MSLGIGVGDFLAVGNLIVKVVDSLRGTRGEYQDLIRELEKYFQLTSCVAMLLHINVVPFGAWVLR